MSLPTKRIRRSKVSILLETLTCKQILLRLLFDRTNSVLLQATRPARVSRIRRALATPPLRTRLLKVILSIPIGLVPHNSELGSNQHLRLSLKLEGITE